MRGRIQIALGSLALLVALSACASGVDVTTDWLPGVSFADMTTYTWIETDAHSNDTFTHARIRASVDSAMASRGFRIGDSDADLAVGYKVTTDQQRSFSTVSTGWGTGYRWGWGGRSTVGVSRTTSTTRVNEWEEGTIILSLFDTGTKDMVWTGSATARLDPDRSPQERQERIDEAIEKMMRDFPPGS